ncbi:hypothetical protein M1523_02290 [Patescibacteria group bacterium]|nr:hypothetical protein [Patescibacteria group bacterium]MCL5091450.1 hypothetical protein [Patescibacteria group bacterium]
MKWFKRPVFIGLLLVIITLPAWFILLNQYYPSMHDDQHIARLFLLDQGLKQGYLYPRWVDWLGFGFGYPLFNFYPPLIYYVAEAFHLLGFSLIWSIKLMIITGFIGAAAGIYVFVKTGLGRRAGILAATLFTFFFYHAVTVYVRGALAEFFSFAVFAWLIAALQRLDAKPTVRRGIGVALAWAALILTHPLIALPAGFFIGAYGLYSWLKHRHKTRYLGWLIFALIDGLALSAFFWIPALFERQATIVSQILTKELADFHLHFVYPDQFWYSPWGFGGSVAGRGDGMTFQLGKIPIILVIFSLLAALVNWIFKKKSQGSRNRLVEYGFYLSLLLFSLFMATGWSGFVWDRISYLAYIQFPWRFLTFTAFFISVVGAYAIGFISPLGRSRTWRLVLNILLIILVVGTAVKYRVYFQPQRLLQTSDAERTSFTEIAWRISHTSFEFVPRGVPLTKSPLGTTVYRIAPSDLSVQPAQIVSGSGKITVEDNRFQNKTFLIDAVTPVALRLNTYDFPGWKAEVNGRETKINHQNQYRLITVTLPRGKSRLTVIFGDTPLRLIADALTAMAAIGVFVIFLEEKRFFFRKKPGNNNI